MKNKYKFKLFLLVGFVFIAFLVFINVGNAQKFLASLNFPSRLETKSNLEIKIQNLNADLVNFFKKNNFDSSRKDFSLPEFIQKLQERKIAVIELLKQDPEKMKKLLLPEDFTRNLSIDLRGYIETPRLLEGTLAVLHKDDFSETGSKIHFKYILQTPTENINLNADHSLLQIKPGSKIKINGLYLEDFGLFFGQDDLEIIDVFASNPAYNLLVIPVYEFKSGVYDLTIAEKDALEEIIFGSSPDSIKSFYLKNSNGMIDLQGKVLDEAVPLISSSYYTSLDLLEAITLVDDDIDFSVGFNAYLFVQTDLQSCSGGAYIGPIDFTTNEGDFSASLANVQGTCLQRTMVKAHEIGHMLGLWHASSYIGDDHPAVCSKDIPLSPYPNDFDFNNFISCIDEYGDDTLMGHNSNYDNTFVDLSILQKNILGANSPIQTAQNEAYYDIYPIADSPFQAQQLQALSIPAQNGTYYVEYREQQPSGVTVRFAYNTTPGFDFPIGIKVLGLASYEMIRTTKLVPYGGGFKSVPFLLQTGDSFNIFQDNSRNILIQIKNIANGFATVKINY